LRDRDPVGRCADWTSGWPARRANAFPEKVPAFRDGMRCTGVTTKAVPCMRRSSAADFALRVERTNYCARPDRGKLSRREAVTLPCAETGRDHRRARGAQTRKRFMSSKSGDGLFDSARRTGAATSDVARTADETGRRVPGPRPGPVRGAFPSRARTRQMASRASSRPEERGGQTTVQCAIQPCGGARTKLRADARL